MSGLHKGHEADGLELAALEPVRCDPHDERQWVIEGTADMEASRAEGGIVARVDRVVDRGRRW